MRPIDIEPGDPGGDGRYPPATPAPPATGGGTPTPTPPPPPPPPPPPTPTPPAPSLSVPLIPVVLEPTLDLQFIPLAAVPAQTLAVSLADQPCVIDIYQRSTGLYVDLRVAGQYVIRTALALDRNSLVRDKYRGFVGDLVFVDTRGEENPQYAGLDQRWQFFWVNVADA